MCLLFLLFDAYKLRVFFASTTSNEVILKMRYSHYCG